ncbi:MAG: hypothetical protein JRI68_18955 [Deltaproteobacteria bacterium]|nr:hypothetical protein [Deltaproteobacteria bacterium]
MDAEHTGFGASLAALFDAERESRRHHDELAAQGREGQLDELLAAVRAAVAEAVELDPAEATLRLVCIARLLGEFDGALIADGLIDVLNTPQAEARHEAGEQLQGMACDRFGDVSKAVTRALKRLEPGSLALAELPYVLVEIPEPRVIGILGEFLAHQDADAVAAAIEALAEVGDGGSVELLARLEGDKRVSSVGEDDEAGGEVTIGELASEAIELLGQSDEE